MPWKVSLCCRLDGRAGARPVRTMPASACGGAVAPGQAKGAAGSRARGNVVREPCAVTDNVEDRRHPLAAVDRCGAGLH